MHTLSSVFLQWAENFFRMGQKLTIKTTIPGCCWVAKVPFPGGFFQATDAEAPVKQREGRYLAQASTSDKFNQPFVVCFGVHAHILYRLYRVGKLVAWNCSPRTNYT